MKVCIFSDLQLGAGADLGRNPGDRLEDQVAVGRRIIEIAHERGCALILNGGDTFEGPIVQPEHYQAFRRAFDGGPMIRGCLGNGKHDRAKGTVSAPAVLDSHVGLLVETFTAPRIQAYPGVVVAFLPWCPVDRLVAANGGGERSEINREAAALLIQTARDLRAECEQRFPGVPAILLGHWCVEGATAWEFMAKSEPVLPLADLQALGFDLVAMGHIHEPGVLCGADRTTNASTTPACAAGCTTILSIGSPMPLNFGETGYDHGCWIYDTETREAEFVPIESRRMVDLTYRVFESLERDLGYEFRNMDLLDAIVKLRYTATAEQAKRIDHRKLTEALYAAGAHKVWRIEANVEREKRARVEVTEDLGEMEALDLYLEAQRIDGDLAKRMRERTKSYLEGASA